MKTMLSSGAADTGQDFIQRQSAQVVKFQASIPFLEVLSCYAFQPSIQNMGSARDINVLCPGDQLQGNIERSPKVRNDYMRNDAASSLRQFEALRQEKGQDRYIWEERLAPVKQKLQTFRVQSNDEVDLALAVAPAHQLHQKLSVFRTGVAHQVQVFIELVSDADPTGL